MTLDDWGYLKSKWFILVDKMVGEIYTRDEDLWISAQQD